MRTFSFFFLFCAAVVHPQDRTVTFVSDPESCQVYIYGSLRGTTPFTTTISDTTDHHKVSIRIAKPGFVRQVSVLSLSDLSDTISTVLRRYASLKITSVPESASVFIDSVFYGKTPFFVDTLNPRMLLVTVVKQYHAFFAEYLSCEAGSVRTFSTTLQPLHSPIAFKPNSTGTSFFIDGNKIADPQQPIDVQYGGHVLYARDPSTGATAEKIVVIEGQSPRVFAASLNEFSYGKMLRGIVIPSLNQFEDRSGVKAQIIMSSAIASVLFYSYAEYQYQSSDKAFRDAQHEYSHLANSIPLATAARSRMEEKHDKLNSAVSTVNVARILPIAVWGLNAVDVVLNHSIINIIEELSGNTSLRLGVSDGRVTAGITIPF